MNGRRGASTGEVARERSAPRRLLVLRAGLLFLLFSSLLVGEWARFAPGAFREGFAGLGRAWVSVDGAYNEHLVRDVGGLQLAVAMLLLAALLLTTRTLVLVAALSSIAWQAPHAVYHLIHVGDLPTPADRVARSVLLLISLALAATPSGSESLRRSYGSAGLAS